MPRNDDDDDTDDRPRRRRRDDDDDDDRPRRRRDEDDEDDEDDDRPKRRKPTGSNGMATTSLVLGVLSLCGGCFTGVPAMLTGFMGLSKAKKVGTGKGLAIAGLATGAFGTFVVTGIGGYFGYEMYSAGSGAVKDSLNGRQIGLAAHNYAAATGTLPNPYGPKPGPAGGPFGQPAPVLLSWRVDLLPYLEQAPLAQQFDMTQPWNGPKNAPLAKTVVKPYQFSYDPAADPQTRWRGFTAKPDGRGSPIFVQGSRTPINSVTDGTSNTLFCFEAADPAGWTEPNDFPFGPNSPMPAYGGRATRPALFLLVDGSVRMIQKGRLNDQTFRAMVTKDGAEVVLIP